MRKSWECRARCRRRLSRYRQHHRAQGVRARTASVPVVTSRRHKTTTPHVETAGIGMQASSLPSPSLSPRHDATTLPPCSPQSWAETDAHVPSGKQHASSAAQTHTSSTHNPGVQSLSSVHGRPAIGSCVTSPVHESQMSSVQTSPSLHRLHLILRELRILWSLLC